MINVKKKKRVLIAEKDLIIAEDLRLQFKQWGYDEASIINSFESLLCQGFDNGYDLIVIDENLHQSDSCLQVISTLMRKYNAAIVFLSNFIQSAFPDSIMAEHSFYFVPKPYNKNELKAIAGTA